MANLTEMEAAFCAAYVRNGRKPKAAALEAGYAPGKDGAAASVAAAKLLKRPAIQAEIKRIEDATGTAVQRRLVAFVKAKNAAFEAEEALTGEIFQGPTPEEMRCARAKTLEELALTRAWVIERMMRNAMICMGEEKVTTHRILKVKGQNGQPDSFTAVEIEVFERDAAGANTALGLLAKELDKLEPPGTNTDQADSDAPAVASNPQLEEAMRNFQRRASAVFEAARANEAANGRGH